MKIDPLKRLSPEEFAALPVMTEADAKRILEDYLRRSKPVLQGQTLIHTTRYLIGP